MRFTQMDTGDTVLHGRSRTQVSTCYKVTGNVRNGVPGGRQQVDSPTGL